MFSVEARVGRLIEIRLVTPISMKDIQGVRAGLVQLFQRFPGKLVCVADLTRSTLFTPAEADLVLEVLKADNPRLELSAFLLDDSAALHQQIQRLFAQAKNPARRAFQDPDALKAFLVTALTDEEHGRLARFLAERFA